MTMLRTSLERRGLKAIAVAAGLLLAAGCSSPSTSDGGTDGGPVGMDHPYIPPPSCVSNPMNYQDFLNGCTKAIGVVPNQSSLPLQFDDGGVPPPEDFDGGLPPDMCPGADAGTMDTDAGTADAGTADSGM